MPNRKVIERLWEGYRAAVVPKDAGPAQVSETRLGFYAGAAALFSLLLCMLEPGTEATDKDMQRMNDIHDELEEFAKGMNHAKAK